MRCKEPATATGQEFGRRILWQGSAKAKVSALLGHLSSEARALIDVSVSGLGAHLGDAELEVSPGRCDETALRRPRHCTDLGQKGGRTPSPPGNPHRVEAAEPELLLSTRFNHSCRNGGETARGLIEI